MNLLDQAFNNNFQIVNIEKIEMQLQKLIENKICKKKSSFAYATKRLQIFVDQNVLFENLFIDECIKNF